MGNVVRLPVQHRDDPHCAACGGPLPSFKTLQMQIREDDVRDTALVSATFHVRCACGVEWDCKRAIE